ncbi:adenylate cyclase type 2 [Trichonephila clavipes]|nr:adenylate cyclase type 2 [Trichonephila clavipes]
MIRRAENRKRFQSLLRARHIDTARPMGAASFRYCELEVACLPKADIVNSMLLAASLKVSDLVATLNDLFGRFDEMAEKNGCMRIKLLGDCYYCVSGISDKSPRHADNSVVTGLAMIDIIRSVREKRSINVDMRIGIHTGNILGGLLGLRKWQFDIWSKDVTIASHMEQGGVPGQIHITQATKDQLMDDWYDIRPGDGHLRDAYLQTEEIRTYLIRPIVHPKEGMAVFILKFSACGSWSRTRGQRHMSLRSKATEDPLRGRLIESLVLYCSATVLPNLTGKFSGGSVDSIGITNHKRTWGRKQRLISENHDNSSCWEEEESEKRGVTKRMLVFGAPG